MTKLPGFTFYPGDWLKDPNLRSVSLAARGLWIDMLSLMFECVPRGYLRINKTVPDSKQLSRLLSCPTSELDCLISELDHAGVLSKSNDGCIFSRRMLRDEKLRKVRVQCGKLGGNPKLLNQKDNHHVNHQVNQNTESESENERVVKKKEKVKGKQDPLFDEFWKLYPRKIRKGAAYKAWNKQHAGEFMDKIRVTLAWEVNCEQWTREGDRFIPHPATWLNAEGWNDEPPPEPPRAKSLDELLQEVKAQAANRK